MGHQFLLAHPIRVSIVFPIGSSYKGDSCAGRANERYFRFSGCGSVYWLGRPDPERLAGVHA
jgi:hypothetical protein